MKSLSFCITCKNRIWQLCETLPKNLEDNKKLKSTIEFILVDFDSTDGLSSWIKKEFKRELQEGYLRYYFTKNLRDWHASKAKNTSHLWSTGKFVVNLDCDNYTGINGGEFVLDTFAKHKAPIVLHQFSGDWEDGSFGRISLSKEIFLSIGGYDEAFEPMGWQDIDLMARLWTIGVEYLCIEDPKYNRAVKNTKIQSIAFSNSRKSYREMNTTNRKRSFENIMKSMSPVRNSGIFGIRDKVYDHNNLESKLMFQESLEWKTLIQKLRLTPKKDLSYIQNLLFDDLTLDVDARST